MVFLKPKPLTIEGWGRSGGGFLVGPSLPNHDVKGWKGKIKTKTKERKQNQGQTVLDKVREKQNIKNNNLYDAWHEWTNDACSNALKTVQFYQIKHNWTKTQNSQSFKS